MKKMDLKSLIPHFIAIAVFTGITLVYFSHILEGKKLYQTDKLNYIAMSKDFDRSIAFKASVDLVLEGDISPSGYTEPILHKSRLQLKSRPD